MTATRSKIQNRIAELAALRKVYVRLTELQQDIDEQSTAVDGLRKALSKELDDFEKMQELSVRGLFYKVLGSQEEQEEKDRQEYLKANLEYIEAKEALDLLIFEDEVLGKKVLQIPVLEEELEELKDQRRREILKTNTQASDDLQAISSRRDICSAMMGELEEATTATETSRQSLAAVIGHIDNALRWGRWDMSSKGAGYYDHQKQSAMDRAIRQASHAQRSLHIMTREIADVGLSGEGLSFSLKNSQGFMSVFFDNLISDWIVQQRITSAKTVIQTVLHNVDQFGQELSVMIKDIDKEVESLNAAEDQILSA